MQKSDSTAHAIEQRENRQAVHVEEWHSVLQSPVVRRAPPRFRRDGFELNFDRLRQLLRFAGWQQAGRTGVDRAYMQVALREGNFDSGDVQ